MIYLEVQFETESRYYRFSSINKAAYFITIRGITDWTLTDMGFDSEDEKTMNDDEYEFVE